MISRSRRRILLVLALCAFGILTPSVLASSETVPNDERFRPTPIGSLPAAYAQSTQGATVEPDEPSQASCGPMSATVWYYYHHKGPLPSAVWITTHGSSYDTVLAVYHSDPEGDPVADACNNDVDATTSAAGMLVTLHVDTAYLFQVGGRNGATGDLRIRFDLAPLAANADPGCALDVICADVRIGTSQASFQVDLSPANAITEDALRRRLFALREDGLHVPLPRDIHLSTGWSHADGPQSVTMGEGVIHLGCEGPGYAFTPPVELYGLIDAQITSARWVEAPAFTTARCLPSNTLGPEVFVPLENVSV